MKSLDCALIGVCAVTRSNTVCFIEIPVFNANGVDPDQMHSAVSDLDLSCLPITLLGSPD